MKHLIPSAFALLLLLGPVHVLHSQDSELGALPPLPDLDLGDPQRKLSWKEKRERTRKLNESRYEDNVYERMPEDTGRATIGQRLSSASSQTSHRARNP